MPHSQSLQDALLQWINVAFSLDHTVRSMEELEDGVIFANILHELDASYDSSDIKHQDNPRDRRRNLESVFRSLRRFVRNGHFGTPIYPPNLSFFRQVSDNPDDDAVTELLALFLGVAASCEPNEPYLKPVTKLDPPVMQILAKVITQQTKKLQAPPNEGVDANETADLPRDHDLATEERLARTNKELDRERKKYVDLYNRHQHLTDSYDALCAKEKEGREEFEKFQESHGDNQSDYIKVQQEKIRERDELIATQELQIEDDRQLKERLQRELNGLAKKTEQLDQLSDENKELRHMNEDLERKANAGERYKQKLETMKSLEATNQALLEEKNALLLRTKDYDAVLLRNSQLEATEKMFVRNAQQYEKEALTIKRENDALIEEIRDCRARIMVLEATKAHDEKIITEQREQLQVQGIPAASSPTNEAPTSTLEQELLQTNDPTATYALEISRLRAENNLLRTNMPVASENERLRSELESSKRSEERLQEQYNDAFEKLALRQKQIEALMNNMTGEGTKAFSNVHNQALKYKAELEEEIGKNKVLQGQLNDKNRELISAKSDLGAVEKSSVDALEILKSSDELISHSLEVELNAARKEIQDLRVDISHKNAQLMDSLLSKEALRKRLEEANHSDIAANVDEIPTAKDQTADQAEQASMGEKMKKTAEKLEKMKVLCSKQKTQLEKLDQEKYELQRRLKAAESGAANAAQKAANDQIIKNLQRENAMIATAWYDLTSRLQSNHVVLQRRHDVPKSWLNKQRQMVNATPRR